MAGDFVKGSDFFECRNHLGLAAFRHALEVFFGAFVQEDFSHGLESKAFFNFGERGVVVGVSVLAVFFGAANSSDFVGGRETKHFLDLEELLPRNDGFLRFAVVIDDGFVSESHRRRIAHVGSDFESGFCR